VVRHPSYARRCRRRCASPARLLCCWHCSYRQWPWCYRTAWSLCLQQHGQWSWGILLHERSVQRITSIPQSTLLHCWEAVQQPAAQNPTVTISYDNSEGTGSCSLDSKLRASAEHSTICYAPAARKCRGFQNPTTFRVNQFITKVGINQFKITPSNGRSNAD
jgi:hypothetical protein